MRSWIIVLLAAGASLGLVEMSTDVPAPAFSAAPDARRVAAARVILPTSTPGLPSRIGPEIEVIAESPVSGARPVPTIPSAEDLLRALRVACGANDASRAESVLGQIRALLETPNEDVERTVAREVHRKGLAARRIHVMLLTYPDTERGRVLRSHIAETAPPAPAALPSLSDPLAVASLLGGPRPGDEKLWVMKRLDAEVLASADVRSALLDVVVRSVNGEKLATTALRLLRRGSREEVESVLLRTIDSAAHESLRRTAVRLLRDCAGPEGIAQLLRLVRDDPDTVTRRFAASSLSGHRLDAAGIETLRSVATDIGEDRLVRMNALHTLQGIAARNGAGAALASQATLSVDSNLGKPTK